MDTDIQRIRQVLQGRDSMSPEDVGEASFDLKTYHQWLRGNRLWLRESQGARVLVLRTAQEAGLSSPRCSGTRSCD